MRSFLLPTLGAVLLFGSSGALAAVIRDPQKVTCTETSSASIAIIPDVTQCIQDICLSGGNAGAKQIPCGSAMLTLSSAPSDAKECVDHFQSVIKQCTTPEKVYGGVSKAHGTQYEISVTATRAETDEALEKRAKGSKKPAADPKKPATDPQPPAADPKKPTTDPQTPAVDPKKPAVDPKKPAEDPKKPAATPKTPVKSATTKAATLTTATRSASATSSSSPCPVFLYNKAGKNTKKQDIKDEPKLNGKSKKPKGKATGPKPGGKSSPALEPKEKTSETLERTKNRKAPPKKQPARKGKGASESKPAAESQPAPETKPAASEPKPALERRSGRGGGGAVCVNIDRWYRITDLLPGKVKWWRYSARRGWEDTREISRGAYDIIRQMPHIGGKLDVIRIKRGRVSFVGDQHGDSIKASEFIHPTGDFLLTNGGFFVPPGRAEPQFDYASIGQTSININDVTEPREYAEYYKEVVGDDDSYIQAGPDLKVRTPLNRPEFVYNRQTAAIIGSLSHASQPNERLGLVKLRNGDKYVFAYTADERGHGVDVNEFGDLIDRWLDLYIGTGISSATQAINLDGGTSIHVSFNGFLIAQGSIGDGTPGRGPPRPAASIANVMIIDS